MKKFLALYEEENKDELDIDTFKETIQKLKDVYNNATPVQTAAVMLVDIIEKMADESDDQQSFIDSFQSQLDSALETAEMESGSEESPENEMDTPIDFSEKFDDMNDEDESEDDEKEDDADEPDDEYDGFMLDDVEKNSKNEKFQNLKKITSLKKEGKSKPKNEE